MNESKKELKTIEKPLPSFADVWQELNGCDKTTARLFYIELERQYKQEK